MFIHSVLQSLNMQVIHFISFPDRAHVEGRENVVVIHPDFRMIVLANRPGFPFLGNDFFGTLGK